MKKITLRTLTVLLMALLARTPLPAKESLIVVNEGSWQSDNGRLSYFEDDHVVSNQWFRDVNGYKLGDTPQDIIQVKENLIAISVNWSNIIQFIDEEGKAVGCTEDVPNNRRLATDGTYLYVTSYGHECSTTSGTKTFTRGFVAKIDATTFKTVDAVEVGYEPEGIAYYNGSLFVANTGGYAYQEDHDYESTVSVIDAATMQVTRTVDTGQINLYSGMSISGKYLCFSSPGDYYTISAATIIFDCEAALAGKSDSECFVRLDYPGTYNCKSRDSEFYVIGSTFSYITYQNELSFLAIDPEAVMASGGSEGVSEDALPGTMVSDMNSMTAPYGIYVNPYTGYIYASDAKEYATAGDLWQWSPEGEYLGKYQMYLCPGHFLALDPQDGSGMDDIHLSDGEETDEAIYDLQGIRVTRPQAGNVYIRNGKKFIYHKNTFLK